jgi:endonuclease YncB( thermonuclease family)
MAASALRLLLPIFPQRITLGKVAALADGRTFTMEAESEKVRVRICGIDAPARGKPGYC